MFDIIGDYIGWVTRDGWTTGSIILLALSAAGALFVLVLAFVLVVTVVERVTPPYGEAGRVKRANARAERAATIERGLPGRAVKAEPDDPHHAPGLGEY